MNPLKSRFANPKSLQIQAGGLMNLDLRVRTVKIRIADSICRPFFKRFVLWILILRPKISNYLNFFVLEGFVYESCNLRTNTRAQTIAPNQ